MNKQSPNIRILLADDHTIVRQGLAKLLESEPGLEVVGQAQDGWEAIQKVEAQKPDVVIMDISMPHLNGLEATRQIKKAAPETKILVLSMYSQDRYISEVLKYGASGYLLKDSGGEEIIHAVQAAMSRKIYLSPAISKIVVHDYLNYKSSSSESEYFELLTAREREVFQLLAEGHTMRGIAEMLSVSLSTVKTHKSNIKDKLNIDSTSQLIQLAIKIGIVDLHSSPK
jgi:DNA-binding NarL/FixJ family response regulator